MTLPDAVVPALTGLLAVVMAAEGAMKFAGLESQVEGFREFGYPQWFRVVVGGLELLGGIGLFVGVALGNVALVVAGGAIVATVLLGAVGTHVRVDDPLTDVIPAAVLLVLCLAVVALHAGPVS